MLALLLAAAMSVAPSPRAHRFFPHSVDARLALLEAKEMLQSQQLWHLTARMPPDTLRVLDDLQLHLRQDADQEERVRVLTAEVESLQQRLAALEMIVRGSLPDGAGNVIPVAPTQQTVAPKKKKRGKTSRQRAADSRQ